MQTRVAAVLSVAASMAACESGSTVEIPAGRYVASVVVRPDGSTAAAPFLVLSVDRRDDRVQVSDARGDEVFAADFRVLEEALPACPDGASTLEAVALAVGRVSLGGLTLDRPLLVASCAGDASPSLSLRDEGALDDLGDGCAGARQGCLVFTPESP
jgi:hypothetical protein